MTEEILDDYDKKYNLDKFRFPYIIEHLQEVATYFELKYVFEDLEELHDEFHSEYLEDFLKYEDES